MFCEMCGTKIGTDLEWNGFEYVEIFVHNGEEITHCPGCGEWLGSGLTRAQPDRAGSVDGDDRAEDARQVSSDC